MNRRSIAAVALVLTSLGTAAVGSGCGSPSGNSAVASSAEAVTTSCTTPFTVEEQSGCHPVLGKMVCSTTTCVRTTQAPTPPADPSDEMLSAGPGQPAVIPPPTALAEIGCTWGIQLTVQLSDNPYATSATANFWVCRASDDRFPQYPSYSTAPLCPTQQNGLSLALGTPCELDYSGTPLPNAFIGTPDTGWTFVEEFVAPNITYYVEPVHALGDDGGTDGHTHGCAGACPGGEGNAL